MPDVAEVKFHLDRLREAIEERFEEQFEERDRLWREYMRQVELRSNGVAKWDAIDAARAALEAHGAKVQDD